MRECASDLSTTMPCHEGDRGGTGVLMCVHIELKWYSNLNTAIHSFAATRARVALSFPRSVAGWLAGASVGSRLRLLLWVYRRTNRLAVVDDDEWRAGLNSILMILNTVVVGDRMDGGCGATATSQSPSSYVYLFIYLFTRTHVAIDNNNNSCDHDDIHGTYSLCVTEEEVEVMGYNVISLYHHHRWWWVRGLTLNVCRIGNCRYYNWKGKHSDWTHLLCGGDKIIALSN